MKLLQEGTFKVSVKTMQFLEPMLAAELKELGATDIELGKRIVHAKVNLEQLYRCNLELRTALRVLVPIIEFQSRNPEDLYKRVKKVEWDEIIGIDQTFAIDAAVNSPQYRLPHYAALKAKDAIADYFKEKVGRRPDVDKDRCDVRLHLHIDEHKATLSLDSSGESLNRRGYRENGAFAPLNEVLAAAMVKLSGWNGEGDLYIPMCGSGTLAIEAAMIADNVPACWNRSFFGFMNWMGFDQAMWKAIRAEALKNIKEASCRIFASDVDAKLIHIAEGNCEAAGMDKRIRFEREDFFVIKAAGETGTLIINPPYGERLEQEDIDFFYKRIGDHLKQNFSGHTAWVISSNIPALKNIGLKPAKRIDLLNGPLECKYVAIELFRGNRVEFVQKKKGIIE
jgi:putative N6-adenine-specific DNA methylase